MVCTWFEQPPRAAHGSQVSVGVERIAVAAESIMLKGRNRQNDVECSRKQRLADHNGRDEGVHVLQPVVLKSRDSRCSVSDC